MASGKSNNSSGIEVDGIYFETLVSERKYNLPIFGEETPIKFGVRITNNSSIPYRFELPHFVPEILNPHGNPMEMSFARNATRFVEESDIPLIISGQILEY
ncbi:MAG: hypothetical protein RMY28_019450 [Nostoc sp. ChiSLP01]|nr:hypothetical protein [Nostoc sp. CmiSLP01]MDZ8287108.1 hypothetical protein [Nostoc sp. ChiSLP01]